MKKLNKILQTYNKVNLKLKEASFNASTCDLFIARHKYNQRMVKLFYIVLKMFKYWQNLIDNADLKNELAYRLESGGVYEIEQTLLKIKRGI